jgi:hypothetical protein
MTDGGASADAGGEYHSHSVLFGIRVPTAILAGGG